MKKLLLLFVSVLALSSCQKEDVVEDKPGSSRHSIVGTWEFYAYEGGYDDGAYYYEEVSAEDRTVINFLESGDYTATEGGDTDLGTWRIVGDFITLSEESSTGWRVILDRNDVKFVLYGTYEGEDDWEAILGRRIN